MFAKLLANNAQSHNAITQRPTTAEHASGPVQGGQHVDSRALDGPISSGAWADMPLVKRQYQPDVAASAAPLQRPQPLPSWQLSSVEAGTRRSLPVSKPDAPTPVRRWAVGCSMASPLTLEHPAIDPDRPRGTCQQRPVDNRHGAPECRCPASEPLAPPLLHCYQAQAGIAGSGPCSPPCTCAVIQTQAQVVAGATQVGSGAV
ncbi:hypothetical protein X797_005317 [Metarhizium robertsii]|uniref:Uncharacterized protein n=1 Tax=Metarhizium robertsii TaxID=568076 RepID=A0A0A1UVH4_9HYPO|nr:hypothetical protein X797_005317 [Metarhizium robertsii]